MALGDQGVPLDLTSRPDGGFLAVGLVSSTNAPAAWLSDDGASWIEATGFPPVPDDLVWSLGGVTRLADRYVAFGWEGFRNSHESHGVIWTSPEGETWTKVADVDGWILSVAPGGPGLVAVGTRAGSGHFNGAVAWSSTDGVTWVESPIVPDGDDGAMTDLVPWDGAFLAVGGVGSETGPLRGAVWRSADGVGWESVAIDPAMSDEALADVAVVEGRLVATSSVQAFPPSYWSAAIWASNDGRTWSGEYERGCCSDLVDVTGDPNAAALLHWYGPEDRAGGWAVVAWTDEGWQEVGSPAVGDVQWTALVTADAGPMGLGFRPGTAGESVPVVLVPPPN